MKKISLVVFPALTIVLEALPLGAVCTFAPSPTERVRETFSYFSLIPFGYANFAPLITAILTVVILLLSQHFCFFDFIRHIHLSPYLLTLFW